MHGQLHPFSHALYERDNNGHVVVSLRGERGLFRWDGSWIEGDRKSVV